MTAAYGSHQLLGSHFEGMRFCFQVCEATADESVAANAKTETTIMSLLHQGFDFRETTRKVVSPFQASRV